MQSDLPHTLYMKEGYKKGGMGSDGTYKVNPADEAFNRQEEANRRAAERRAARERGEGTYTTNELFKK